jgi:DNA-binding FadR family transcriptional regulator
MDSIQPRRIYLQIADQISALIQSGEFPVGSLLPPERDLAIRFAVSRSSIREGLIALEVRGIVDVRVGSGARVVELPGAATGESPEALLLALDPELGIALDLGVEVPPFSILQARRAIEPECAALACVNATDGQIAQIEAAYRRNVADNARGSTTHPGDRLFHIRIAEASGNPAYAMFVTQLVGQRYGAMFRRLQRLYTPDDMPHRSEHEHAMILAAIQQRRSQSARMAMCNHLDNVTAIFSRG